MLSLRDDDHAGLLVDVHQRLNASAVKKKRISHRVLLKLVLRVDLVDDLEDQLLHHQRGRTGQIDPVI